MMPAPSKAHPVGSVALRAILLIAAGGHPLFAQTRTATEAVRGASGDRRNSWPEPALFPSEPSAVPSDRNLPQRSRGASQDPELESSTVEDQPFTQKLPPPPTPAGLQRSFAREESNNVGLQASRERDAILARLENDSIGAPYNFKIGRIPFHIGAGMDASYSDNIDRSGGKRRSDIILYPRLDVSGSVKLGSKTSLTLGLGIGYLESLGGTQEGRLITTASLSPDTGISLDAKIGKFIVSIYDKPVVPQFQTDSISQRTQSQYNQFVNSAGLSVLWDVNSSLRASFRYGHSNSFALTSEKNTSDGSTDSFLASLSAKLSRSLGVGLEASLQKTTYKGDVLNSGTTYHMGPSMNYEFSDYLSFAATFGYQGGTYGNDGTNNDNSALGTFFVNASLSNQLNSRFNHSLSVGRESQNGAYSNYVTSTYVRYQAVVDVVRNINLGFTASLENAEESGGVFASSFVFYSVGMFCNFRLTSHINIGLSYSFSKRAASEEQQAVLPGESLDFFENRITLHLGYSF